MLTAFVVVRLGDVVYRGAIVRAFSFSLEALMFWIEIACFVAPLVLLGSEVKRRNPANLFLGGVLLMAAGALLRINGFLVGYETGDGFSYFPSIWEIVGTAAMFSIEVVGYIYITRNFPVLPREVEAH